MHFPQSDGVEAEKWVDLSGQLIDRNLLPELLACEQPDEADRILERAFNNYQADELRWIGRRFGEDWRKREGEIAWGAAEFEKMVETDRAEYMSELNAENNMLRL